MKKIFKPLILLMIIPLFSFLAFTGCTNNTRIEELEKNIVKLQEGLSEKDKIILELQSKDTVTEQSLDTEENIDDTTNNDEEVIKETINKYIEAVETQNFFKQKEYVAKYALDLVNLKEEEYKKSPYSKSRNIDKQEPKVEKIENNKAEGFMSFSEHLVGNDNSEYDLITEGRVLLEKINGTWKIVNYTRKNYLISEMLYSFENLNAEKNNVNVTINRVLFSLYDKYIVLKISLTNNSDKLFWVNVYNSKIIGADKIQNKCIYPDSNMSSEIMQDATIIGELQYDWSNPSTGNFKFYTGDFIDKDGYTIFKDIMVEIDLNYAIRY
jgi:hypothetical protein